MIVLIQCVCVFKEVKFHKKIFGKNIERVKKIVQNLSLNEILDVASSTGYYLLKYGAEINRVEDTVQRICYAYGADVVHVFAIAATMVTTIEKDGVTLTQSQRVQGISPDLDKVEKMNALSRWICENKPSYEDVVKEGNKIKSARVYSFWWNVLAYALVGGGFAVFFGGGIYEMIVGFVVGFLLKFVMQLANRLQSPPFFANAAGAAFTVTAIHFAAYIFGTLNTEITNIGVLMNLVPGVLLTNCIRDFVATDYTAGAAKIMEAFMTAAAIALGVGVSLLWR